MTFLLAQAEANQSLVVLITGFAVVFAVLLLLIGIIKIYGGILYGIANRKKKKAEQKNSGGESAPIREVATTAAVLPDDGSIDLQTIAVIAAAVEAYYGGSGKSPRIKSVRRSAPVRNEWAAAGLADNIASRRGF